MMSRRSVQGVLLLALCVLVAAGSRVYAQAGPPVVINEILAGNASTNLDPTFVNYGSWVELLNTGASSVNLAGYTISDDLLLPDKWTLPTGTQIPAGGRLLLWLDEQASGIHANFELDMDGSTIALFMPDDTLVTSLAYPVQRPDVSFGQQPDGSGTWVYFDRPTPGAANTTPGLPTATLTAPPVFSVPGGSYPGAQSVELTAEVGATIRYTTDGSKPTFTSPVYSGPINVNAPRVVRARAFAPGKLASMTATATYLIGFDSDLAVVSLATDPAHFFDNSIGIYAGSKNTPGANFNQPWERPVSMEFYETTGALAFRQDVGVEIHGGSTRAMPQKSLELKTRKRYGDNDIDYQIFPDNPLDEYRRLVLRAGGNHGAADSIIREPMAQEIHVETMGLDQQQYRPVVVFINGAYWGIYGLRDKADESLIEQNYGYNADDEFDMIKAENKGEELNAGNFAAWDAFFAGLQLDLTNPVNYANVASQMDVGEFIDHSIVEVYTGNFIGAEYRYWRPYEPGGVWRWVLIDLDNSFNTRQIKTNTLKAGLPRNQVTAEPLRWLLDNPDFRAQFAQRFASHLNITYTPARVNGIINAMSDEIASEVPNHIARWGKPRKLSGWEKEVAKLRNFANERPSNVWSHLNKYFGNPGTTNLTVNTVGSGQVRVAGVSPLSYPYSGTYFRNMPLTLEAVPAVGYLFVEWQETGQTDPQISLTLSGPQTRTAVFAAVPAPPDLVINEVHYLPAAPQTEAANEFIEIYNNDTAVVNLAGYTIDAIAYTFPAGATIDPGEYIVVAADSTNAAFSGLPAGSVFDFAWEAPEKLSNGGEAITLKDSFSQVADVVTYDDIAPWPTAPDGTGPTLSLLSPSLDNSLPASWAASAAAGGTPGAVNFP